jgi:hypothetical protein
MRLSISDQRLQLFRFLAIAFEVDVTKNPYDFVCEVSVVPEYHLD